MQINVVLHCIPGQDCIFMGECPRFHVSKSDFTPPRFARKVARQPCFGALGLQSTLKSISANFRVTRTIYIVQPANDPLKDPPLDKLNFSLHLLAGKNN